MCAIAARSTMSCFPDPLHQVSPPICCLTCSNGYSRNQQWHCSATVTWSSMCKMAAESVLCIQSEPFCNLRNAFCCCKVIHPAALFLIRLEDKERFKYGLAEGEMIHSLHHIWLMNHPPLPLHSLISNLTAWYVTNYDLCKPFSQDQVMACNPDSQSLCIP